MLLGSTSLRSAHRPAGFVDAPEPPLMAATDLAWFDAEQPFAETPPDDAVYDGGGGLPQDSCSQLCQETAARLELPCLLGSP